MNTPFGEHSRRPLGLQLCLVLIGVAALLVPGETRQAWKAQWRAELLYRWQRRAEMLPEAPVSARNLFLWSAGAFQHSWYLFRTEYTMDVVLQDVKFGIRAMRRNWGLIVLAVVSLGLGIGANTTIFSAVDVFMLSPLPHPEAAELHMLWLSNPDRGFGRASFTAPDYLDMKDRSTTMEMAAARSGTFSLSGDFEAERLVGSYVTPGFFGVLGEQPVVGRSFTQEEGLPGNDASVIISHSLWERRYGSNSELLGSTIALGGVAHTVVGIMPEGFWYRIPDQDLWVPLAFTGEEARDNHYLSVLARVDEGVARSQALEEANTIMSQISQAFPETSGGNRVLVQPLRDAVFDDGFQAGTMIASVGVLLVLLIACANVANLLLTHAAGREREVALRGALGASRSRIVRQFLTEATIVSVLGGAVGLGLAIYGIKGMVSIMPPEFPRVEEIGLSIRVLSFTAAISMLTGIVFGLAPALQSTQGELTDSLKEGARGVSGSKGARLRKGLVVGEVALALVLVVSSALLVQGFVKVRLADLGFDRSDVLTIQTLLPEQRYADLASVNAFWGQLAERLNSIPGVESVGGVTSLPMQGDSRTWYVVGSQDFDDQSNRRVAEYRYMTPGYLDAMDIPLLQGRGLEGTDRSGALRVAVINQALANRHWPDGGAVGGQIETGSGPREVVGVVGNTRNSSDASANEPMMFLPAYQTTQRFMDWAVEVSVPMSPLIEAVRTEISTLDPTIPAYDIMSLDALIDRSTGGDTIMAKIMAALAMVALALSLGGVYGVMSHSVSQRTRELGIRMSLGAHQSNVMLMVVKQGTRLALIGIFIGTLVALATTRGLSRFLYGVSPFDPLTFGSVALILFVAGFAATLIPARRATRVDPVVALRAE